VLREMRRCRDEPTPCGEEPARDERRVGQRGDAQREVEALADPVDDLVAQVQLDGDLREVATILVGDPWPLRQHATYGETAASAATTRGSRRTADGGGRQGRARVRAVRGAR
jgi:hypothetical protein